jgi:glutathione S-transferase
MKLYIGNKNYSSWSLRPWVLMRELAIPFEETIVRFDSFDDDSTFKAAMRSLHPTASVPVLEDKGLVIADTLAITEYLGETFPDAGVWPNQAKSRHQARVLVAVMHSGFGALRGHCPMNIEADLPEVGARLLREEDGLKRDLDCLHQVLEPQLQGGKKFLFGDYSAADAFYAPVMSRLKTYHLPLSEKLEAYSERIHATSSMTAWIEDALAEEDFLDFDEPYRESR